MIIDTSHGTFITTHCILVDVIFSKVVRDYSICNAYETFYSLQYVLKFLKPRCYRKIMVN